MAKSGRKYLFSAMVATVMVLTSVVLLGCESPENPGTAASPRSQTSVNPTAMKSEMARMLGMVPYSFLQKHDVWFGNPGKAMELNGIESIKDLASLQEYLKTMPPDKKQSFTNLLSGIAVMNTWRGLDSAPLIGFDGWMPDRIVSVRVPPPWSFSINEGDFNEDLIKTKLVEQGYTRVDYGSSAYYSIREDYGIDVKSRLCMMGFLADLNRIFVSKNMIVTSSTTGAINGILDTMADKEPSVMDKAAGQALADSLGEVYSGVFMNPERTLNMNPQQEAPRFKFTIPADWGKLHQYDMVGMGYKYDGKENSWIISLYYTDVKAAALDADILVNRMRSYVFDTQVLGPQRTTSRALTDRYRVGKPVVKQYPEGATLTVECLGSPWPLTLIEMRDLLFLAPDPERYVATSDASPTSAPSPTKPPPLRLEESVFSVNSYSTIGAEPGYSDAAHQMIQFHVTITNRSSKTMKNVRVVLSTMATNEAQRPQIIQASPEIAGHLDFEPGQSETYNIAWKLDGSNLSKAEIMRMVEDTTVTAKFITQDGREITQSLYPNTR